MDYEKAYKESFEAAKGLHDAGNALTKKQMEIVFPQLAESEDERIRKWIHKYIAVRLDDAGEFIGEYREALAWLEKQKENPKSSDSIPSDCTADAKYEGGWHKVGDSLPDNPREVICKDEAGNYFIGRYYVGEGWDISNYDDEDKSHHLNPPVSKWIDFPLEKQKEQKPAEWSEDDKQILHSFEVICQRLIENPHGEKFEVERSYAKKMLAWLKFIHPQPKQEWSEEIIRKAVKEVGLTQHQIDWFKTNVFPPKQEWSEEDYHWEGLVQLLRDYQKTIDRNSNDMAFEDVECYISWLKSLRPQSHWKPTEEQMKALLGAEGISRASGYPDNAKVLASLYEDLKKL